jgi:hypothetical protein
MSTTLNLDTIDPRPEPRRDRYGRYLVVPPGGGKPKAYTRVTSWAKALDDQGGLINWSMRMCAIGLTQRQDLYAQVAACRADDRQTLSRLVEQAKEHGGGSTGAGLGTALHAFTERIDLGEEVAVPDPWQADVEAYLAAVAAHGLTVCRRLVERVVVLDKLGVAGTLDRVYVDRDGTLVVGDVKTGSSLDFSRLAIAVQLACYANAETLYDLTTETHEPMVDVRKDVAVVMHLPAGQGRCDVYEVDIAEGWKYAQLCGLVRSARAHGKRSSGDCLFSLRPAGRLEPTPPAPQEPVKVGDVMPQVTLRAWVLGRLETLKRPEHHAAALAMMSRWPKPIPGFKGDHQHSDAELDAIAAVLDDIEREYSVPFGDRDPRVRRPPAPEPVPAPSPRPAPAEGEPVEAQDVDGITKRIDALDGAVRAVLNTWAGEAHQAGVGFNLRQKPSARRYAIYRACLELAHLIDAEAPDDDEQVRATVALIVPDAAQPAVPIGQALGALTLDEATRLAGCAAAVRTRHPALTYGDDGRPQWHTGDVKALIRSVAG